MLHNTPVATQLILYVGRGGDSGISINYEHQACQIRNLNIFFSNFKLSALKGMERGTNNIYLGIFLDSAETDVVKILVFFHLLSHLNILWNCVSYASVGIVKSICGLIIQA